MVRIITVIITIIALLPLLSGCSVFKPRVGAPWMQDLLQGAPKGPLNFKKGWRDGCETGISSSANHFHKTFYKFQQNYQLSQDNEYYTGWKTAFNYCQRYTFQMYKRLPF